jgi:hypothetical protein
MPKLIPTDAYGNRPFAKFYKPDLDKMGHKMKAIDKNCRLYKCAICDLTYKKYTMAKEYGYYQVTSGEGPISELTCNETVIKNLLE